MRMRTICVLAVIPTTFVGVPLARTMPAHAGGGLAPVTTAVPLERRPDIAALFAADLTSLHAIVAASMSDTVAARFGPLTPAMARQLGRSVYFRPVDVALYAVPTRDDHDLPGIDDQGADHASFSVVAVPLHARVGADGSVTPPAASPVGLADPTFSTRWGDEEYFTWEYLNVDDGGVWCDSTLGRVRGQWEYARLSGVAPTSAYDYWGVAQRSVAEIVRQSKQCQDAIDWFVTRMKSRTPGAYGARQSPLTQPSGSCVTVNLSISATFSGIAASISQPVQKCERWHIDGALASSASTWYGVTYDNAGVWGKFQRESGAIQVLRVPKGAGHGLNTQLDIDVDNKP